MKNLREYTYNELVDEVGALGEKRYRALQIFKWVVARGVTGIDSMTDVSKVFRERLKSLYVIEEANVVEVATSKDGTRKFLTELFDGVKVETVIIPGRKRTTLCVSTQAGCALGCAFCMTGRGGFVRNLTLAELTGQLHSALAILRAGREEADGGVDTVDWSEYADGGAAWGNPSTERPPITNIVLMGMGEPLLNYDNVLRFLSVLTDGNGFGISHNKVTLSTAGVVPALKRLGKESNVNIAVSLNATTNAVRDDIMPINRKYPIEELLGTLASYPLTGKKHITFEYVLLGGLNDSDDDAYRLVELLRRIKYKLNLIPFNAFNGSRFASPTEERLSSFYKILQNRECNVVIRASMGGDISAACGQLQGEYAAERAAAEDSGAATEAGGGFPTEMS